MIAETGTRSVLFEHPALLLQAVVGSMYSLYYEPKVLHWLRSVRLSLLSSLSVVFVASFGSTGDRIFAPNDTSCRRSCLDDTI